MITAYTTNELLDTVSILKPASMTFLDKYFPIIRTSDSQYVHIDIETKKRRLAPFVAPRVKGRVVHSEGFTTRTLRPPYIKDLRIVTPEDTTTRSFGEAMTGNLSRQERLNRAVNAALLDQLEMVRRRKHIMCIEQLRTGKLVIVGEDYPEVEVDFMRNAQLTDTTDSVWTVAGVDPLKQAKEKALICLQETGTYPRDLYMEPVGFGLFSVHPLIKDRLNIININNNQMSTNNPDQVGAIFAGTIDGFNINVFQDWYVDSAGVEQPAIPSGSLIGVSSGVRGIQFHGAIEDLESGMQPLPFFSKSRVEFDPSGLELLSQSSPLPAMIVPDASFCITGNAG